jgi:hypothetical protein
MTPKGSESSLRLQRATSDFPNFSLRLDRLELRAWLLRRLRNAPLAEPIDPARFAISDDMAALLKAMPLRADDANRGTGL